MSFDSIIVGDFGQVAQVVFKDVDAAEADISSYAAAIKMVFTDPSGVESEKTATFVTDGSDGAIEYTTEDGLINAAGHWRVRGRVTSAGGGGAKLTTEEHTFLVKE
jgi:hypothetical protein